MKLPRSFFKTIFLPCLIVATSFYSCQELEEEVIEATDPEPVGETVPEPEPTPVTPIVPLLPPAPNAPSPTKVSGPMDPSNTLPFTQINTEEYTIELDRWDIPNTRIDPLKTTNNLQAAIDWATAEGFGTIRLPAGHYLVGKYGNAVYQAGIELKSNMAFLLDKDAVIEMDTNDKWNYCAITVTRQKNVLISGGTVVGDRYTHTYTPRTSDGKNSHDEGHCICVQTSSENVAINNMVLKNATGDGILLVAQGADSDTVKNITIINNNIGNNRRQGISVVGGENVHIEDNEIHHIKGIAPQYGIDIESYPYKSQKILIRSNYFHNNVGHILNFDGVNTIIEENYMEQGNDLVRHLDAPVVSWNKANVVFRNNFLSIRTQSSVSNWNGFLLNAYDIPHSNKRVNEIANNTFIRCGIFMQNHENAMIRENSFEFGHVAMKNMKNVRVFNNTLTHDNECWPLRFDNVTGLNSGNKYNGKPVVRLNLMEDIAFSGACQDME